MRSMSHDRIGIMQPRITCKAALNRYVRVLHDTDFESGLATRAARAGPMCL
ncbi:hypothetical protein MTsPCn3_10340 [Erythrobacter sp. MTPC3]